MTLLIDARRCPLLIGILLLAVDSPVAAQAVDCTTPANPVQKTICSDTDLKALDAKMAGLYAEAVKVSSPAQQKEIAAQHARWTKSFRDVCAKESDVKQCVTKAYTARNELLASYASTTSVPPSSTRVVKYTCADKSTFTVVYSSKGDGLAQIARGATTITLPNVPSASGARYANAKVSLWNKETEVTLDQGGTSLRCSETK